MWLKEEIRNDSKIVYASGKYFWVSGVIIGAIFASVFAGGCFQVIQLLNSLPKNIRTEHRLFTAFNFFYIGKERSRPIHSVDVSAIVLREESWQSQPYWTLELKLNDGEILAVDSGREEKEMRNLMKDLAETLRVPVNKT